MARRPKPVDAAQVVKLGRLGLTQAEIADVLGVSQQTISRRFRVHLVRARALLRMSLRRAQYRRAIKDKSDRMLIHLGRCELGQGPAADRGAALAELLADLVGQGDRS